MQVSSRTDLVPVIDGRPVVIKQDGWTVFVAIHDQEYLRVKREWKRKLFELHPDRSGIKPGDKRWEIVNRQFRSVLVKYGQWRRDERVWYWRIKLMPPDWIGPLTPPSGWKVSKDRRLSEMSRQQREEAKSAQEGV